MAGVDVDYYFDYSSLLDDFDFDSVEVIVVAASMVVGNFDNIRTGVVVPPCQIVVVGTHKNGVDTRSIEVSSNYYASISFGIVDSFDLQIYLEVPHYLS